MDAVEFLREVVSSKSNECRDHRVRQWMVALLKTLSGASFIWVAARGLVGGEPLLIGWIAMSGLVLFLHFGVFEMLAIAWQSAGIRAKPVMREPLRAVSLAEFWGSRWNTAFNTLAHDLVFRPLARHLGVTSGTLGVFAVSGLIHEAVISLPAGGGYGLPTGYFVLQGIGVLCERSRWGRRLGLGRGLLGRLGVFVCVAGPAFWLFHPAFVLNVLVPMLRAIAPK